MHDAAASVIVVLWRSSGILCCVFARLPHTHAMLLLVLHNYSFHVLLRHMVFSFVQDVWDRIRDGHRRQGKGALLAELLGHDDTNDWSDADDARR